MESYTDEELELLSKRLGFSVFDADNLRKGIAQTTTINLPFEKMPLYVHEQYQDCGGMKIRWRPTGNAVVAKWRLEMGR